MLTRLRRIHIQIPLLLASLVPLLLIGSAPAASAATGTPSLALRPLAGPPFTSPVWVGGAGDNSAALYVAEQQGIVWRLSGRTRTRFLDIRSSVASSGEQGLLSIAFSGDLDSTGAMFAYFTRSDGAGQVRRFTVRRGRVVAGSGRNTLTVPLDPPAETNHNGGQLWMTGAQLWLSVGDGGGGGDPSGNAQRLDRLTGKLLRITPRAGGGYATPGDNPFVGRAGARPEIYALGLRNPWRFSIDSPTGDIWIGDVGQGDREEIDVLRRGLPAGANFGWRRHEGDSIFDAGTSLTAGTRYVPPFHDYTHARGECSVTGGVVYRGPVRPLRGWYLHADYCTSRVTLLDPVSGRTIERAGVPGIVHFGAGHDGDVYASSQQTGRIYRVASA